MLARDLGVGQAEPQRAGALVERGFGDQLAEQLPVEAERARLVGRDRPAELAAELLQPVVVDLAELLDPDFGAADLGARVDRPKPRKMSPMPQMREADGDQAENDAHDGAAEPIGGGSCEYLEA